MSDVAKRMANLTPAQRKLLEQRMGAAKPTAEPIAVVGMACRFAGARNLSEYWRVINEGIEAISEVPPLRWDIDQLYDPTGTQSGKMSTRWGGFVDDIDQFDPQFFGITPREAARMDPQQRLLLEVAWEAMENAGRPADQMAGSKTAVYVGIGGTDYAKVPSQLADYYHHIDAHVGTGNALSIAANRISYIFDLHGPSAAVDTACSSASLAIHLAVESLRRGECAAAFAGGVNAIITPETTIAFSKARMLSPEGKCRPFDARANGYVRGEGCGLLLLKRLADAERDGDNILAVIRATSVNQDGRTSGISAPNGQSQQECIRAALNQAGVKPSDVSYIEAHGTGTPLGDPIEMQALVELFRRTSDADQPLHVTSVKANIGHTETVSGVAGVIKTILLMQHETIVPQLHLESINPHISLAGSRIVLPTQRVPWPAAKRRLAGISSFGFGGTNTHLLIEAPPVAPAATPEPLSAGAPAIANGRNGAAPTSAKPSKTATSQVLKLSGRTPEAVAKQAESFAAFLQEHAEVDPADVAYSANTGRADFNHRAAVVWDSREKLVESLTSVAAGKLGPGLKRGQVKGIARPKVAMLFTGQGSQYPQMGRELYDTEPVFRQAIDQCDEILRRGLNESLLTILFPESDDDAELINETVYTQPALFSLEYATAQLWRSRGIEPHVLLGHSIGEYVAATVAGCMTLEEGLGLISERARLMQQVSQPGKMAVVFAGESEVASKLQGLSDVVAIAAVNGPENTVISGDSATVDRLVAEFQQAGLEVQPLTVSHAFHSPLMDEMLDAFEQFAAGIDFQPPRISLVSNLTGAVMTSAPTPRYWRDHVRSAVRFMDGARAVAEEKASILLEVGPTASLLGMVRRSLPDYQPVSVASLRKGQPGDVTVATATADLYVAGATFDWRKVDTRTQRRRVVLPNYPFSREPYWFDLDESPGGGAALRRSPGGHPLLGSRVPSVWSSTMYETMFEPQSPVYLADHQVQGSVVVPGAAFIEQGLAAAREAFGPGTHGVADLSIQAALFLSEDSPRLIQVAVEPEAGGRAEMNSYSTLASEPNEWTGHASVTLVHESKLAPLAEQIVIDIERFRAEVVDRKDRNEFYQIVAARGLVYGPHFQVLDGVERTPDAALAPVVPHESVVAELSRYRLHPVLGDACMQTLASTVPLEKDGSYSPFTYMPVGARQIRVLQPIENLATPLYCYAVRRSEDGSPSPEWVESDVYLIDGEGNVFAEMLGARVQRIGRGVATAEDRKPVDWLYRMAWKPQPLVETDEIAGGAWVVFADNDVAPGFVAGLGHVDRAILQVRAADTLTLPEQFAPGQVVDATIDPTNPEHYASLFDAVAKSGQPLTGVVHLWSLDIPLAEGNAADTAAWETSRRLGPASALLTIQHLARLEPPASPRLWLATAGAQAAGGAPIAVGQAPLVGLSRAAAVEHAELRPTLIDLDPAAAPQDAAKHLLAELASRDWPDSQIAYRKDERLVARLEEDAPARAAVSETSAETMVPEQGPYQLRITTAGSFDALQYTSIERKSPGEGEVEFQVRATGLNFSDVLKALGLYPGIKDEIVPLGIEASGVVTAVGPGVDRFQVGDEVMGVAPYAFASHAITREYTLVPKPQSISHEEAATVPITFLTAYYALVRIAQVERGERVLIHAAAGGVGLAAIQICQHLGAEVFATAGSDEKRDFLRSLGVQHIYSSRSLDFAEQILDDTQREGVDVVLNSLPGEAISKSLSILRAYGRFLEIGKTDIYQNRKIGLLPFQDNLSYHAIDLDRMLRQRPEYIRGLFAELMENFTAGTYQPELFTSFSAEQTIDAFRYMSQRKNIGKVVVAFDETVHEATSHESDTSPLVRQDGTYLITGGLGGLGLQVAHWLADQGAGGLVLLSRRKPDKEQADDIRALEQKGAQVASLQGDVLDFNSLGQGLHSLPKQLPPLRGVVHAAGVLADGMLADMSLEALDKAMLPKTVGAWNLHTATLDQPLDFFVLFSSVAAILGSPGQGNYAAGNATLDALAHYRQQQGLPATSINWGPWAARGMAAATFTGDEAAAGIQSRGMDLLPAPEALELMSQLMAAKATQTTVMDVYWSDLLRLLGNRRPSILSDIATAHGGDVAGGTQVDQAFRTELAEAGPESRVAMLRDYIQAELARIMSFEPDQLDVDQPLTAFGLDSLMALELKNNLEGRLAFTLPMAKLLEGPSISSLAGDVVTLVLGDGAEADGEPPTSGEWQPIVELKKGTTDPLVFLPALGGDVRIYSDLVPHLPGDRRVIAFRPRGLDDASPPVTTMQELVVDYTRELRKLQPAGPYHLAAWSAGGIAAHALAAHLLAEGEEVALLALFDTALPNTFGHFDIDDEAAFLIDLVQFTNVFAGTQINISLDDLQKLDSQQRFAEAVRQARQQGMFPPGVTDDYIHRLVAVGAGLVKAIQSYEPRPLGIPVHLYVPETKGGLERLTGLEIPPANGWDLGGKQQVVEVAVPGDHFSMVNGPGAQALADQLNQLLAKTIDRP